MNRFSCLAAFFVCLFVTVASAESAILQSKQTESEIVLLCRFENQRNVMLSETEHQLIWHENGLEYPTSDWSHIRVTHDPILSVFAYGPDIGSPRLDVFQGVFNADKPNYELGTAILSETLVGRDKLLTRSVEGFCEAENQN
ncbi:hypothetical protein [Ruegeria faecimaris]|uniref:hypothetical protein n=1 Tax=Ruegeria faecimaris TaxID=686389 RepID=UPI0011584F89|nr:hypothetical protein [Ruegeria faecimaris]